MCPCVVAAPLFPEILLIILLILAGIVMACWKALPYIGVTLGAVIVAAYRWVSGAVLTKELYVKDDDYWDTEQRQGRRGPRFTRPVRATARLSLVAVAIGLLWNPLAVAIIASTLSVLVTGGAIYGRRDRVITTCRELTGKTRSLVRR